MNLDALLKIYGTTFEEKAEKHDSNNLFVSDNLEVLKRESIYKMMVPLELGGQGVSYLEACLFIKNLAKYCSSTALTLSMHLNLVSGLVFKHRAGDESATNTLKLVAENNWALLSTGGGDWISSNGQSEKVVGGYKINCRKAFCSGAQFADIAVMSCVFKQSEEEYILHFSVPMNSEGITIIDDWDAMGMRGTGSCTLEFKNLFIPEEKIALKRERGKWHPALNAASTFVFPMVMSTYAGVTEKVAEKTVQLLSSKTHVETHSLSNLGEMNNHLKITQWAYQQLLDNSQNLNATPTEQTASEALQAKALLAEHSVKCAQSAMAALGGFSYYKRAGVERLYRDLIAGDFHPVQAAKQKEVMGGYLLGKSLAC